MPEPTFAQLRALIESNLTAAAPLPADARLEPARIGGVPCTWIVPAEVPPDRLLFYLHGGGYCLGSVRSHGGIAARVARAAGARALVVDYRLAPEHRFPVALDDAVAAYRGVL